MRRILKLIQRNYGIPRKEILQIVTDRGYRQALIDQAIYYGFISQSIEDELDNDLFYYLTEKGCKVLEACEKLGITSEIRAIVLLIYTVGQRYIDSTTFSIIDSNSLYFLMLI